MAVSRTGDEPVCLLNAHVLTGDDGHPRVEAVALRAGRIVATGSNDDARGALGEDARIVDCGGRTVLPGFIDPHVHLLALARSAASADLSPRCVDTMAALAAAVQNAAAQAPAAGWVRAHGYDEFYLRERRHPTRHDIDRVVPDRPVRIRHRSRHASVLNSAALRFVAAHDPDLLRAKGVERDVATGEPTGVLYELDSALGRIVPRPDREEIRAGLREASERLLAAGVTVLDDVSASTGPEEWRLLHEAVNEGLIRQRARTFWGAQHHGLPGDEPVTAIKLMLDEGGGHDGTFHGLLESAHRRGWQVAVHAVEGPAITVAVAAFRTVLERWPRPHRHRIEHCALCPTALAQEIAALGLVVVAQPGFISHVGERYIGEVPLSEQPWLYPLRTLLELGVAVAGSSDAPVGPISPLVGIAAAVDRRSGGGAPVAAAEALSLDAALRLYGVGAAYAADVDGVCGRLMPGYAADVVVLDRDLSRVPSGCLADVAVERVFIRGHDASAGEGAEAQER